MEDLELLFEEYASTSGKPIETIRNTYNMLGESYLNVINRDLKKKVPTQEVEILGNKISPNPPSIQEAIQPLYPQQQNQINQDQISSELGILEQKPSTESALEVGQSSSTENFNIETENKNIPANNSLGGNVLYLNDNELIDLTRQENENVLSLDAKNRARQINSNNKYLDNLDKYYTKKAELEKLGLDDSLLETPIRKSNGLIVGIDNNIPIEKLSHFGTDENGNDIFQDKNGVGLIFKDGILQLNQATTTEDEDGNIINLPPKIYGKDFSINEYGLVQTSDETYTPYQSGKRISFKEGDLITSKDNGFKDINGKPISFDDEVALYKDWEEKGYGKATSIGDNNERPIFQLYASGVSAVNKLYGIDKYNDEVDSKNREDLRNIEQGARNEEEIKEQQIRLIGEANAAKYNYAATPQEIEQEQLNMRANQIMSNGGYTYEQAYQAALQEKLSQRQGDIAVSTQLVNDILGQAIKVENGEDRTTLSKFDGDTKLTDSEKQVWNRLANDENFGKWFNEKGYKKFGRLGEGLETNASTTTLRKRIYDTYMIDQMEEDSKWESVIKTKRDDQKRMNISNAFDKGDVSLINAERQTRQGIKDGIGYLQGKQQSLSSQYSKDNKNFDILFKREEESAKEFADYKNGDLGGASLATLKNIANGAVNVIGDIVGGVMTVATPFSETASKYVNAYDYTTRDAFQVFNQGISDSYKEYSKNGEKVRITNGKAFRIDREGNWIYDSKLSENQSEITRNWKFEKEDSETNLAGVGRMFVNQGLMMFAPEFIAGKLASSTVLTYRVSRTAELAANALGKNNLLSRNLMSFATDVALPKKLHNAYSAMVWGEQTNKNNVVAAQEAGLSKEAAYLYGLFGSATTMALLKVSPDAKFFGEYKQINSEVFKLLSENKLKQATNKMLEVSKKFGRNIVGEGSQEELERSFQNLINAGYNQVYGENEKGEQRFSTGNFKEFLDTQSQTAMVVGGLELIALARRGGVKLNLKGNTRLQNLILAANTPDFESQYLKAVEDNDVLNINQKDIAETKSHLQTIRKYTKEIPPNSNLTLAETEKVILSMQEIDKLNQSTNTALSDVVQDKINEQKNVINSVFETAKKRNENNNAESSTPTEQTQETVQAETTNGQTETEPTNQAEVNETASNQETTTETIIDDDFNENDYDGDTESFADNLLATLDEIKANETTDNQEQNLPNAESENSVQSVEKNNTETKPIRQLGTGANVYFETDKYRLNENSNGTYSLNIGQLGGLTPIKSEEFSDLNEAIYVSEYLQKNAPKGVLGEQKADDFVKWAKEEYQQSLNQDTKGGNQQAVSTTTDNGGSEGNTEVAVRTNLSGVFKYPIIEAYTKYADVLKYKSAKEFKKDIEYKRRNSYSRNAQFHDNNFEKYWGSLENYYDWVKNNTEEAEFGKKAYEDFINGLEISAIDKRDFINDPDLFTLNAEYYGVDLFGENTPQQNDETIDAEYEVVQQTPTPTTDNGVSEGDIKVKKTYSINDLKDDEYNNLPKNLIDQFIDLDSQVYNLNLYDENDIKKGEELRAKISQLRSENGLDDLILNHGTPHDFEQFVTDKIGTGEGNQAFGWGLYFAENKKIAQNYAKVLDKDDNGIVYTVKIKDGKTKKFIEWREIIEGDEIENIASKFTTEDTKKYDDYLAKIEYSDVKDHTGLFKDVVDEIKDGRYGYGDLGYVAFGNAYNDLSDALGQDRASELMKEAGYSGIKYKSNKGKGKSYNYVIFDANDVEISSKERLDGTAVQQAPTFSDNEQTQTLNETKIVEPTIFEKDGYKLEIFPDGNEVLTSPKGKVINKYTEKGKINANYSKNKQKFIGGKTDNEIRIEERQRNRIALLNFIPSNAREAVLEFFANGGKITSDDISKQVLGNSVRLEARGKAKRKLTDYKWAFLGAKATSIDGAVLSIMDEYHYMDAKKLSDEIIDVINSYSSARNIREEVVDLYNRSVDPYYGLSDSDIAEMEYLSLSENERALVDAVNAENNLSEEEKEDYYRNEFNKQLDSLPLEQQQEIYKNEQTRFQENDTEGTEGTQSESESVQGGTQEEGSRRPLQSGTARQEDLNATSSPEYRQLLKDRETQEARVKSTKESLDRVSRNTNANFQADQENIFGERPQAEGMFDERADGNAGKEIIAKAKREYDQAKSDLSKTNKAIRDFESGNASGTGAIDFNIVPFKATKENSAQYEKAVDMFNDNQPLEKIWKETGFFLRQNTNDKTWEWAYRIDQNKMKVSLPSNLKVGDNFKLSDVVDYPEFFTNFPNGKNVSVKIEDIPNNRIPMQLSSDGKTLTVNKFYYENDTEQQRKSDIAHEIQHYIQVETEKGGGTNTEIVSRSKKRQYSIQANNGKRLVLNNLTDAQLQDVLWKTEDAELSLNYLNGNDNIPQHIKDKVNEEIQREYESNIGEREGRLATTDLAISPYESYNQDAETLGIKPIDFEAETRNLRGKEQSQKSNETYQKINKQAFNNLIERLKKAFAKAFKNLNITTDWNSFSIQANSLGISPQRLQVLSQDFRDGHTAPLMNYDSAQEALDNSGDFNLAEVARGIHNQPSDYFDEKLGARYYGYNDTAGMQSFTAIKNIIRAIKAGKNPKDLTITLYRAVPNNINVNELIQYDWVTPSEKYAKDHGESRFGEGEYKIIKQESPIIHTWWDGNDIREWGYDPSNEIRFMHNANGTVYGAKLPDGTIFLNPEKLNANTPIHEFSHLWEQIMPKAWAKGLEIFKQTKTGKDLFEKLKKEGNYQQLTEEKLWSESMNTLIGNLGEQKYHQKPKGKMAEFIDWFKTTIGKFLNRISPKYKDMVFGKETQLRFFTDTVLGDLLGERELTPETTAQNSNRAINYNIVSNGEIQEIPHKRVMPKKLIESAVNELKANGEDSARNLLVNSGWYEKTTKQIKSEIEKLGLKDFLADQANKIKENAVVVAENKKITSEKEEADNQKRKSNSNSTIESYSSANNKITVKGTVRKAGTIKRRWFANRGGDMEHFLGTLEKAEGKTKLAIRRANITAKELKEKAKELKFADDNLINDALNGVEGAIDKLPIEIADKVRQMRAQIDGLTDRILTNGYVSPETAVLLEENKGKYVNRSYSFFEKKDDFGKVFRRIFGLSSLKSSKHYTQAVKEFAGFELEKLRRKKEWKNKSEEEIGAEALRLGELALNEYIHELENEFKSAKSSKIATDLSPLMRRKNVSKTIRDLLGEYTDPKLNYVMTIAKMENMINQREALEGVKKLGMGTVFFEFNDPKRPKDAVVKISSDSNQAYAPLNGLYTTQNFKEQLLDQSEAITNDVLKLWLKFTGMIKFGKTVLSPITQSVNFSANTGFLVMNGLYDVRNFQRGFEVMYDEMLKDNSTKSKYIEELIELGILDSNVNLREIQNDFHQDFEKDIISRFEKANITKIMRNIIVTYPSKMYKASDDFFKAYSFFHEADSYSRAIYKKKYSELQGEEKSNIQKIASEVTKNTLANYGRKYKGADAPRKLSANFLGNFLSFQAESIRTLINAIHYAKKDLKNPNTRNVGIRRLSGIISYLGIYGVASTILTKLSLIGVGGLMSFFEDDDENENAKAFNRMVAPWDRSVEKYVEQLPDGTYNYFSYGKSNPYGIAFRTINALTNGSEISKDGGVGAALWELSNSFVGTEMTANVVYQMLSNEKPNGKEIGDVYDRLFYGTDKLKPGFVKLIQDEFDKKENNDFEWQNLIGIKKQNVDPTKSLGITFNIAQKKVNDLSSEIYSLEKQLEKNEITEKKFEEEGLKRLKKIKAIKDEYIKDEKAFLYYGADPTYINKKKNKDWNMEKNNFNSDLLNGN